MADKPNLHIVNSDERPPVDYVRRDPIFVLRNRLNRSTADRIADALESPFAIGVYVGCYAGCLLTVALAFVWSVL